MSDKDQRTLDGITLTSDAHFAGRIDALEAIQTLLRAHMIEQDAILESDENSVDKMKARGAREEIERLLAVVDEQISAAQLKRDAEPA